MADGEFFDIEAQEIVLFGTPWHGPVLDGELTLPNAETMTYPQPSDQATRNAGDEEDCDYYDAAVAGTNHLIAIPGLPAVTRTTEEAEADTAAGRQWKTQALLCGGRMQLYGHNLKGWIYIDTAGDRWLVTCDKFWPYPHLPANAKTTALNATVRLTRFGIIPIGGEMPDPEYYDYPVSLASGWLTAGNATAYCHLTIDAITRTGNKCAIGVHTGYGEVEGFIEVTISGAGDDATVGLSLLRTFAQCATLSASGTESETYLTGEITESISFSKIYALWYDDEDSVVEVRLAGSAEYSWTRSRSETLAEDQGPPLIEYLESATETRESTSSAEMTISVGGDIVETISATAETAWSGEWTGGTSSTPPVFSGTWTASATIGEHEFTDSGTAANANDEPVAEAALRVETPASGYPDQETGYEFRIGEWLPFFNGHGWGGCKTGIFATLTSSTKLNQAFFTAFNHSRHCFGLIRVEVDGSNLSAFGMPVYTPSGNLGDEVELTDAVSIFRRRDWEVTSSSQDSGRMYFGGYDWLSGAVTLWQDVAVNHV